MMCCFSGEDRHIYAHRRLSPPRRKTETWSTEDVFQKESDGQAREDNCQRKVSQLDLSERRGRREAQRGSSPYVAVSPRRPWSRFPRQGRKRVVLWAGNHDARRGDPGSASALQQRNGSSLVVGRWTTKGFVRGSAGISDRTIRFVSRMINGETISQQTVSFNALLEF